MLALALGGRYGWRGSPEQGPATTGCAVVLRKRLATCLRSTLPWWEPAPPHMRHMMLDIRVANAHSLRHNQPKSAAPQIVTSSSHMREAAANTHLDVIVRMSLCCIASPPPVLLQRDSPAPQNTLTSSKLCADQAPTWHPRSCHHLPSAQRLEPASLSYIRATRPDVSASSKSTAGLNVSGHHSLPQT